MHRKECLRRQNKVMVNIKSTDVVYLGISIKKSVVPILLML